MVYSAECSRGANKTRIYERD